MGGDSLDPVGTGTMSAVEMLVAAANYDIVNKFREFVTTPANWSGDDGIPQRLLEHIEYTVLAVGIAALIALPVGMLIGHTGRGAFLAINIGNAARAIPTLGLLVLVVTWRGIGLLPVLVALVVLAVPPILTSTYAGIQAVESSTKDAARGMGLSEGQILRQVEVPVALPLILSGVRSATLQVIATATIAAYVALGGLGRFLIDGLSIRDYGQMAVGAVLVAGLAVLVDVLFSLLIRTVVSPGVTGRAATRTRKDETEPVVAASSA
jgi:osmoprotectant transport system permease protein